MNFTDEQRVAVLTWRKGWHGSIVSDMPFVEGVGKLGDKGIDFYGAKYLVATEVCPGVSDSDSVRDFILAAAHAAAEGEQAALSLPWRIHNESPQSGSVVAANGRNLGGGLDFIPGTERASIVVALVKSVNRFAEDE